MREPLPRSDFGLRMGWMALILLGAAVIVLLGFTLGVLLALMLA